MKQTTLHHFCFSRNNLSHCNSGAVSQQLRDWYAPNVAPPVREDANGDNFLIDFSYKYLKNFQTVMSNLGEGSFTCGSLWGFHVYVPLQMWIFLVVLVVFPYSCRGCHTLLKEEFTQKWELFIHSLSPHPYADGGVIEVFESTKHFWSFRSKQCSSTIQYNWRY